METSLHIVWKIIPGYFERAAAGAENGLDVLNRWGFLYTIAASISLATAAGASIKYLGFPGDLPNVIQCVHQKGYVPMRQTLPMVSGQTARGGREAFGREDEILCVVAERKVRVLSWLFAESALLQALSRPTRSLNSTTRSAAALQA